MTETTQQHLRRYRRTITGLALWLTSGALAYAGVHLTFHMAAGANHQFVVGGTLENQGDTPIARGYIAVLPVNFQCEPLHFLWHEFGPVPANTTVHFSIPVTDTAFNAYRLVGFAAFDDMGFPVDAVDDTQAVLAARKADDIKACTLRRNMPASNSSSTTPLPAEQ